jgi:hypothetical protein
MTSTVKVNNVQASDGGNIINQCGTNITIGASGDTIALASGASQTGFGRTGTVDWQTGDIKTGDFTAVDGQGFFVNTTSGEVEVTLPTGSAGSIISLQDYNNTFDSNACTVTAGGSQKINGGAAGGSLNLSTEGEGVTLVYIDSTVGWRSIQDNTFASASATNLVATGGTITTCGNFKIHTFTSPGTFTVTSASATAAENIVGYQVVAGGGGGVANQGGAGGGGGFREGRNVPIDNFTASPLVANAPTNAVTVTAQAYPITVGAGGAAQPCGPSPGNTGSNSIFSTITGAGGGGGGARAGAGSNGGSGGGTGACKGSPNAGGSGNTPPTTPAQGTNGGSGPPSPDAGGGGGGGAASSGGNGEQRPSSGAGGGGGVTSSITGAAVARSGGGGGGQGGPPNPGTNPGSGSQGGGKGGGGPAGGTPGAAGSGTVNTGGGGGAGGNTGGNPPCSGVAGAGGSGIVIIRYKYQ